MCVCVVYFLLCLTIHLKKITKSGEIGLVDNIVVCYLALCFRILSHILYATLLGVYAGYVQVMKRKCAIYAVICWE